MTGKIRTFPTLAQGSTTKTGKIGSSLWIFLRRRQAKRFQGDYPSRQRNPKSSKEKQRFCSLSHSGIETCLEQETHEGIKGAQSRSVSLTPQIQASDSSLALPPQARTKSENEQRLFAKKGTSTKQRITTCNANPPLEQHLASPVRRLASFPCSESRDTDIETTYTSGVTQHDCSKSGSGIMVNRSN